MARLSERLVESLMANPDARFSLLVVLDKATVPHDATPCYHDLRILTGYGSYLGAIGQDMTCHDIRTLAKQRFVLSIDGEVG